MRLSGALMEKRITAKYLTAFLTLKSFEKQDLTSELPYQTADYFLLAQQAGAALDALFDPARQYRACGLIATGIAARQTGDFDLFQQTEQQREEKHLKLLEALHGVNRKFGNNTMTVCVLLNPGEKGDRARFGYPVLECE